MVKEELMSVVEHQDRPSNLLLTELNGPTDASCEQSSMVKIFSLLWPWEGGSEASQSRAAPGLHTTLCDVFEESTESYCVA
ncbi:hypothetical protein ATANTOWER_005707 [Ataeniobius toweri]|uniref:Uncharacterized protein n=1 Tax=Ataeniobius toweri TaxID=208326 RepID=A0ABU7BTU5_9TELE|nr:hypothetical protein [Ataeniobius toweri]